MGVQVGDRIVAVNGCAGDTMPLIEALCERKVLNIMVQRMVHNDLGAEPIAAQDAESLLPGSPSRPAGKVSFEERIPSTETAKFGTSAEMLTSCARADESVHSEVQQHTEEL